MSPNEERDRVRDRDMSGDDRDRLGDRDVARDDRSEQADAAARSTAASGTLDDDRHLHDDPTRDDDRTLEDDDATIGPEGYPEGTRLPSLGRLRGMDARTTDGEKVGTVRDVYLDSEARYVRYLDVKTGWFSGSHIVPVDDVTYVEEDACVVVPYSAEILKAAPTFGDDEEMTADRERSIYEHYRRPGYWDEAREAVRARQTAPAPTPQIAEAEVADAIRRGDDPGAVRVKRWGA